MADRLTKSNIEALDAGAGKLRATKAELQTLDHLPAPPHRISQAEAQVLAFSDMPLRIARVEMQVLVQLAKGRPARVIWVGGI